MVLPMARASSRGTPALQRREQQKMATQSTTTHADLFEIGPVVLINMENRADRLRDTLRALDRHVRPGVTARDLQVLRPRRFDDAAGFLSTAYRSCLHAHLQAAEMAAEAGWPALVVLEDDVHFLDAWTHHGAALLAALAETPHDLAMLGYQDDLGHVADTEPGADGAHWQRFDGEVTGSHAYLVNGRYLESWIEHLRAISVGTPGDTVRGPMGPDGAINTAAWAKPDTIRLIPRPNLVAQRPSRSDINTSAVDRITLLRPIASAARRARVVRSRLD
jgi:GR25 family glycosyltransferase involved in LPS biosynthesis